MNKKTERGLWRRLAYIAENCDPNDPEDAEMWREYREIKETLGITGGEGGLRLALRRLCLPRDMYDTFTGYLGFILGNEMNQPKDKMWRCPLKSGTNRCVGMRMRRTIRDLIA